MLGYDRPLYLLPFDHRHSYETGVFNFAPPLTPAQKDAVADTKRAGRLQVVVDGLFDGSLVFGGEESAGASFLRRDGSV
jgi:hypothetical protein